MADLTDSTHANRLIKLLMMLPAPDAEDTFPAFWDSVAKEHGVSTSYVTEKIAVHLKLLLDRRTRPSTAGSSPSTPCLLR